MNISPQEAEESLALIQSMMRKTRKTISTSGAYMFMIVWGVVWILGFMGSHFLSNETSGYVWFAGDAIGILLSILIGIRMRRDVRSSSPATVKRIAIFWLLLFLFCIAVTAVTWPLDVKQISMLIVLFVAVGWIAMGLLLSFASVWWGIALTTLALVGFFFFYDYFYLWMAILGGGGMIALGINIRYRW